MSREKRYETDEVLGVAFYVRPLSDEAARYLKGLVSERDALLEALEDAHDMLVTLAGSAYCEAGGTFDDEIKKAASAIAKAYGEEAE